MNRLVLPTMVLLLLSCGGETPAVRPDPTGASFEVVDRARLLQRASMVLRGTRPSLEEYARLEADPEAFELLVDELLASQRFGATVRQLATEWLELDQAPDVYPAGFPAVGELEGMGTHELNTSVIEAAGRLAEHIVMNDRPWTELVTADYTLADRVVATVWGLGYDHDAGGWQVTAYTDGRPAAGVLSDGWLFTRMPSTEGNRHRERASLIADALICHDYPGRPVVIPADVDLASEEAIANAVESNPVCQSCHHSLDPLASFFAVHYALRIPEAVTSYPLVQYTPEATAGFEPPSWYGVPAADLAELGGLIADDPRFSACAVRRFYSELMHVRVDDVPIEVVQHFERDFRTDFDVRTLVRAIVLSDAFAARFVVAGTTPSGLDTPDVGLRRATPQQLDSMLDELTGYRWLAVVPFDLGSGPVGEVPLMRDPLWGYRTLGGGPNGFDTTTHLRTVDPTTLLVLDALAQRAARHVVEHDTDPETARLLTVPGARDGEPSAVREQLRQLHLRLYGERLASDDPEIDRALQSFDAEAAPSRAWAVTLTALLSDPRMLLY